MTQQKIIQDATQKLQGFKNAPELIKSFEGAVNLAAPNTIEGWVPYIKPALNLALASDDAAEIKTFAGTYARALHDLKLNKDDKVKEVEWADFSADPKGILKSAEGSTLLIRNAFNAAASPNQNTKAESGLFYALQKYHDLRSDAVTPVVLLTGGVADMQKARANFSNEALFVQKFIKRVGIK